VFTLCAAEKAKKAANAVAAVNLAADLPHREAEIARSLPKRLDFEFIT
jgi:hypothetical protein